LHGEIGGVCVMHFSRTGSSVNLDRSEAVIDAPDPTTFLESRSLLGGLVMLRRFESRMVEKQFGAMLS
jgi:hypothetical protein